MNDTLQRFMLRGAPVRGEIVSLDASWLEIANRHDLGAPVRDRLGELAAAALLLAASAEVRRFAGAADPRRRPGVAVRRRVRCDGRRSAPPSSCATSSRCSTIPACTPWSNAARPGPFRRHARPAHEIAEPPALSGHRALRGRAPCRRCSSATCSAPSRCRRVCGWRPTESALCRPAAATAARRRRCGRWRRSPTRGNRMQHAGRHADPGGTAVPAAGRTCSSACSGRKPCTTSTGARCRFACSCSRDKVASMLRMLGADEIDGDPRREGQRRSALRVLQRALQLRRGRLRRPVPDRRQPDTAAADQQASVACGRGFQIGDGGRFDLLGSGIGRHRRGAHPRCVELHEDLVGSHHAELVAGSLLDGQQALARDPSTSPSSAALRAARRLLTPAWACSCRSSSQTRKPAALAQPQRILDQGEQPDEQHGERLHARESSCCGPPHRGRDVPVQRRL